MPSKALVKPGPKIVTIDIASSSAGKASTTSIKRMMMLSARPPANPAVMPSVVPTMIERLIVMTPTESEVRVP